MSHQQGIGDYFKSFLGIYQMRCRRCRARWQTSVWSAGAWRFARCPRCYRQELTTWSEQYYHPPAWTTMLLRMGATPYRCAACRCNFASFRPCKEKLSWRSRPAQKDETPPPAPPDQVAASTAQSDPSD